MINTCRKYQKDIGKIEAFREWLLDMVASEQEQVLAQQMQSIEEQAIELKQAETQCVENQADKEINEQQTETTEVIEPAEAIERTEDNTELSSEEILASEQENTKIQIKSNDEPVLNSPVSSVLATRNMLRSRKKQLAQQEKKSDGAIARQAEATEKPMLVNNGLVDNNNVASSSSVDSDALSAENEKTVLPKPEQTYQAENIDPATIRKANQVDEWAHMIDSMELIARLRQLAIHATIDEASTQDNLILRLDQATKHLYTEIAQQQLQQSISQYLSRDITVTINIVEKTVADPYQIQSNINDKRYDYAKDLLVSDEVVQGLVQTFQATLDDESIAAI